MRPRAARSSCLPLLVVLTACGNVGATGEDDGGIDAAAGVDLHVHHDLARDLYRPTASVKGVAVDEAGQPLANVWMSVCNPFGCRSDNAGPDGTFLLRDLELVGFGVRSHDDITADPMRGSVVRLLHPDTPDVVIDAGRLFVPTVNAFGAVPASGATARALAVGDGVTLVFVRDDLEFPLGDPAIRLGARRIPLERIPAYDVGGEELLGAVAFLPYATTSKSPIGVTVPLQVAAGTAVRFRAVYEFEGKLGAPVAGHAAGDGQSVSTDPGVGLDNLTWVLITR